MTRIKARRRLPGLDWLALIGLVILAVALLLALFPQWFATHDPLALDLPNRLKPPSAGN